MSSAQVLPPLPEDYVTLASSPPPNHQTPPPKRNRPGAVHTHKSPSEVDSPNVVMPPGGPHSPKTPSASDTDDDESHGMSPNRATPSLSVSENRPVPTTPHSVAEAGIRAWLEHKDAAADEAIGLFTQSIELSGRTYPSAYFWRALVHQMRNDKPNFKQALLDLDVAIRLEPTAIRYSNRALAHYQMKNYTAAVDDYAQAIQLDPNTAIRYYNRGDAFLELADGEQHKGQFSNAIRDFSQALTLTSRHALSLFKRGLAYEGQADYTKALADMEACLQLTAGTDAAAHLEKAWIHRELKDYKAALDAAERAVVEERKLLPDVHCLRAAVRLSEGLFEKTINECNVALNESKEHGLAFYLRGCAYLRQSPPQVSLAVADLEMARKVLDKKSLQRRLHALHLEKELRRAHDEANVPSLH